MKGIFVDIETTGLDFNIHVPIEICLSVMDLEGDFELKSTDIYSSTINISFDEYNNADNEALKFNGYSQIDQTKNKSLGDVAYDIISFLNSHGITKTNSFFICQNPAFDYVFFHKIINQKLMNDLNFPRRWLDLASMYWFELGRFQTEDGIEINLSKDSIATRLGIYPEPKPHCASSGVLHLMLCYTGLVATSLVRKCFYGDGGKTDYYGPLYWAFLPHLSSRIQTPQSCMISNENQEKK